MFKKIWGKIKGCFCLCSVGRCFRILWMMSMIYLVAIGSIKFVIIVILIDLALLDLNLKETDKLADTRDKYYMKLMRKWRLTIQGYTKPMNSESFMNKIKAVLYSLCYMQYGRILQEKVYDINIDIKKRMVW